MYYSIILIILQNLQDIFFITITSLLLLLFYYKPKMIIEIKNLLDYFENNIIHINNFNLFKKKTNTFKIRRI